LLSSSNGLNGGHNPSAPFLASDSVGNFTPHWFVVDLAAENRLRRRSSIRFSQEADGLRLHQRNFFGEMVLSTETHDTVSWGGSSTTWTNFCGVKKKEASV